MRAVAHDATAAQIVLDALPHVDDVPLVARFPPPAQRHRLPPLAQLRGAICKPCDRRVGRVLPGASGLDEALQRQRGQLVAARDAALLCVQTTRDSPAVQSALGFCDRWRRFQVWAGKRAGRRGKRMPAASPVLPKPLSVAARRRAADAARGRRAAEAAAATILSVQPTLVHAAAAIRAHCAVRAAHAAVSDAVARACVVSSRASEIGDAPRRACRAQVLAEVVRSRPVLAVPAAARKCPRPREDDVRKAAGRRVVKAVRVNDATDTIRTVVATQCGGGKSRCDGSGTVTLSDARLCP